MPNSAKSVTIPVLSISQPIGDFFVGVMSAEDVVTISWADVRSMENELNNYMGIQRRLSKDRVNNLNSYVNTFDATFPTSVILSVNTENAIYDKKRKELTLRYDTHSGDLRH